MYDTEKASVKSIISSSVTEADTEEYLGRLKKKLGRQDTLLVSVPRPAVKPKIVSMTLDSLSGKISEVSVYNMDNRELMVNDANHRPDVDKVQDLLRKRLDSAGLDVECRLVYEENGGRVIPASGTQKMANACRDGQMILTVPSSINNGQYKVFSASLSRYIAGRMSGVVAISAGILLIIVLAFAMLDTTLKKKRRLDEMKNDFTQNITHELKTPIAVAYAASDTLLEYSLGNDPATRKEYLDIIKDQLDKLGGMVEMILSTTMENRSGLRLDCSPTPVKAMLETAASQIKIRAKKPCDLTVSVIPDNLAVAMDRKLMSSVVLTVLSVSSQFVSGTLSSYIKRSVPTLLM